MCHRWSRHVAAAHALSRAPAAFWTRWLTPRWAGPLAFGPDQRPGRPQLGRQATPLFSATRNPEVCPKRFKIITMSSKSGAVDRRKSMTSSAQREIRCWMEREERGCRRPSFDAFATMRLGTSMPRMNNMGERGSPYRSPR
jgi:hypothetical protein